MKKNSVILRKGLNTGITLGVLMVFLSLTAFTVVLANIIGDTRRPSPALYGFVLVLFGFFGGKV